MKKICIFGPFLSQLVVVHKPDGPPTTQPPRPPCIKWDGGSPLPLAELIPDLNANLLWWIWSQTLLSLRIYHNLD